MGGEESMGWDKKHLRVCQTFLRNPSTIVLKMK